MRQRWLSRRALLLHVSLAIWLPGCLIAFWWQVHRAFAGNGLSYLYSVEWPVFALTGVWAWWQLVHTDPETVGRRAQERILAARSAVKPAPVAQGPTALHALPAVDTTLGSELATEAGPAAGADGSVGESRGADDPELAAYNDRLARLAAEGHKGWRRR